MGERVMGAVRSNLAKVIWQTACEGRGGFCSSDMQDAALEAIDLALQQAEATARAAQLPDDYIWSDSNRDKFEFGRDTAADAIASLRTLSPIPPHKDEK